MIEQKINELREKLYMMISKNADYSEILETSKELDKYINIYNSERLDSTRARKDVV
ncbi:MAG: aspartyl-phosphate phosphatase Spo0E family protein [Clostridiales bacterium]|nr:aspartyl-phosphate phosphatase Spo0E family protein [Clostridiales bacterium]